MNDKALYIGLMTGTSLDATDAVLVRFDERPQLLAQVSLPYPQPLRDKLMALNRAPQLALSEFAELSRTLGEQLAAAANALLADQSLHPDRVSAIGSHGQTIFHAPEAGMSLQIGHPAIIAKRTGISTVADFRVDDMALGGEGAPLAPAFHQTLLSETDCAAGCALINIGGIANISLFRPGQPVLGWDTGPGNGLMDELCQQHFQKPYDADGQLAASTPPDPDLLAHFLQDPYFAGPAPKSTGRDAFHAQWVAERLNTYSGPAPSPLTLLSTLNQLTVQSLSNALKQENGGAWPKKVYVMGGGSRNATLMQRLQKAAGDGTEIGTSEQLGVAPEAVEATMMAWLARERLAQRPIALASVTGAQRNAVLGGVWLP
ncbi:MAG: anhydro-N-acetylmuramic acid kinase [Hydrogenovibrio sp.]|uniref:anhydro-N-acetylmuramic acid kinase n=1 Tax=Hydrogenovibrio sp. TaxID=2065821 RepID=UPI0028706ECF|nr:anhydro-N-acetylmuramic acid kinase [Hydrogenovibrio sp.]MDR9498856.1 anhydro-N-acetylmuramic acid kinase [Hydrogenovibrio sp.]